MTKNNALYLATLAFSLGWLYYNFQALPAPVDCGDGLMHFFISQASWEDPTFFLDHWGKPLFILLSSSFAQLGFNGIILFNVLVFTFTVLIGWKILRELKTPFPFQLAFPLLLLLTPDYSNTVLGGLTEPLFSLFLIAACLAWIKDKYIIFAFIVGCMPFLRSEGQLVVILSLGLLPFARQWNALVYLFVPFLIYAVIGAIALDDFWWYFTKSPYSMDNSFYGVGSYWHYLREFKSFVGIHGIAIFIGGFAILAYQFFRKKLGFKTIGLVVLSYGTFLGIIVAHSYFYGSGQNGSMGLTRIATQGLPSFLVVNMYFMGTVIPLQNKSVLNSAYLFPLLFILLLCTTPYLKKDENRINNALLSMGNYIEKEPLLKDKKIFAYHPLLAYALEANLKMKDQQLQQFSGLEFLNNKDRLSYGDVIVWDSQFGPFEISIPLERLIQDSNLMLIKQETIPGNLKDNGVFIFQYVPAEIKRNNTLGFEQKEVLLNKNYSSKVEFEGVLDLNPSKESYVLEVNCTGSKNLHLVCVPEDQSDYQAVELKRDKMNFEFTVKNSLSYQVYLWNPDKKHYIVTIEKIIEKRTHLPKLWNDEAK